MGIAVYLVVKLLVATVHPFIQDILKLFNDCCSE